MGGALRATAVGFASVLSRSPAHPVNTKANNRAMILIRAIPFCQVSKQGYAAKGMLSPELAAGNMIRENGLPLCKFDGRDGPLAIMARDRNSQTVHLVEPNVLYRTGLAIGEDHGLADKLRLSLIECTDDR
jgi:hypothetical protein